MNIRVGFYLWITCHVGFDHIALGMVVTSKANGVSEGVARKGGRAGASLTPALHQLLVLPQGVS